VRDLDALLVDPTVTADIAVAISDAGAIVCHATNAGNEVISIVLNPQPGMDGDTNCDRLVNIDDLLTVIGSWGPGASLGDLNNDGITDLTDLLIVIDTWTS
jgi:hypothetical protein